MTAIHMPTHAQRVATARRIGEQQMQLSYDAATSSDPSFGARAFAFITAYVRENFPKVGAIPGETITMAAQNAGIGADRDGRAFGAIFAKAIRQKNISVVGYCARVRGHGTSGGRLYAPGEGSAL
jgi:hypothetical protein